MQLTGDILTTAEREVAQLERAIRAALQKFKGRLINAATVHDIKAVATTALLNWMDSEGWGTRRGDVTVEVFKQGDAVPAHLIWRGGKMALRLAGDRLNRPDQLVVLARFMNDGVEREQYALIETVPAYLRGARAPHEDGTGPTELDIDDSWSNSEPVADPDICCLNCPVQIPESEAAERAGLCATCYTVHDAPAPEPGDVEREMRETEAAIEEAFDI